MLTHEQIAGNVILAREVFIRMSLLGLMALTCVFILQPFLLVLLWGIILAIASYPGYRWMSRALGTRELLAAVLCTALLLAVAIVPTILFGGTLTGAAHSLAAGLQDGSLKIPSPPARIASWPVVGAPLTNLWSLASTNLDEALSKLNPYLRNYVPKLLSASAAVGRTLFMFILSIVLAGFLLANSKTNATFAHRVFDRIFGARRQELEELIESTIRSVTNGILGVAVIQTVFAGIGFLVVGLPGAGMWAALFLVASVVQVGLLVLVPAVAYAFATASTSHAVVFLVWCIIVGLMDNVLKPLMLGRGSKVPTAVIFIGVIGGFVAIGFVGLFVGAIILSIGYKLFLAWLDEGEPRAAVAVSRAGVVCRNFRKPDGHTADRVTSGVRCSRKTIKAADMTLSYYPQNPDVQRVRR
jgi:predicted PurR-regulated permease PerM